MSLNKRKRVSKIVNPSKSYPRLTFQNAIDIVLSGKRSEGLRERTLLDYAKMWRYFTEWLAENYPEVENLDEVETDMIRNYINWMKYDKRKYTGHKFINADNQEIGLSDTTININLRSLRSAFNYLQGEDLLEINPMDKIRLLRQDIDLTNCFTDVEVKAILREPNLKDFVGYRDYVGINALLDTGLRINELLGLRMADIDFNTRFTTVKSSQSKNRNSRLVPMSTHVMKLILRLYEENSRHFKTDRLFLSSYGDPIGPNHFNKRLKYYAEKAGIEAKKLTAHVYRHTWAKNMILNGCDPFTLQKIGGWSDIRTMRRYIQMDISEMRKSHDQYSPVMRLKRTR
ncbi:tyrosine-type recombinase/integrase [Metabacillus sp. RGM 3146]|uniref:tyrosine-type recombinase/integrase n=1 Tax=Metabacillus sp. RGM 3146 TaxID=3401092 RepID=UPI003B9D41B0